MNVFLERDTATGASYFLLNDEAEVDHTVHIDDLVMVDVDSHGDPVGIEIAASEPAIPKDEWNLLVARFPAVEASFQHGEIRLF